MSEPKSLTILRRIYDSTPSSTFDRKPLEKPLPTHLLALPVNIIKSELVRLGGRLCGPGIKETIIQDGQISLNAVLNGDSYRTEFDEACWGAVRALKYWAGCCGQWPAFLNGFTEADAQLCRFSRSGSEHGKWSPPQSHVDISFKSFEIILQWWNATWTTLSMFSRLCGSDYMVRHIPRSSHSNRSPEDLAATLRGWLKHPAPQSHTSQPEVTVANESAQGCVSEAEEVNTCASVLWLQSSPAQSLHQATRQRMSRGHASRLPKSHMKMRTRHLS